MKQITIALLTVLLQPIRADDGRVPVIVELFTSEGCSSCPPADELLAWLERTQPVSNARVIALEEHVDYWNQLGWNDRFSNALFRGRQNDYARLFRTESIYTPQMVVNGQAEFVGDDAVRAHQEIARAAVEPGFQIELKPERSARSPELTQLGVRLKSVRHGRVEPSSIYLAVTESRLSSNVAFGENAGRQLRHAAVVRSFGVIGKWDPKGVAEVELLPALKIPTGWKRENLRCVVFVQEKNSQRITGAAVAELR